MGFKEKLARLTGGRIKSQVAREAGLPQTTVSDYINKGYIPRADLALRLAKALDVSVEWLIDDEQGWPPPSPQSAPASSVGHDRSIPGSDARLAVLSRIQRNLLTLGEVIADLSLLTLPPQVRPSIADDLPGIIEGVDAAMSDLGGFLLNITNDLSGVSARPDPKRVSLLQPAPKLCEAIRGHVLEAMDLYRHLPVSDKLAEESRVVDGMLDELQRVLHSMSQQLEPSPAPGKAAPKLTIETERERLVLDPPETIASTKVPVGSTLYTVRLVRGELELFGESAIGLCKSDTREIFIANTITTVKERMATFWHELAHAWDFVQETQTGRIYHGEGLAALVEHGMSSLPTSKIKEVERVLSADRRPSKRGAA
jgi:hypothetical protein